MKNSQNAYQVALICFAFVVLFGIAAFAIRELFSEYKAYQNRYKQLAKFHSSFTGAEMISFPVGVKQIFIANQNTGVETVERCISCHLCLDLPHFSKVRIVQDANGKQVLDEKGQPVLEPNPDYVWINLEKQIAQLQDPATIDQLKKLGKNTQVKKRLKQASELEKLKTIKIKNKEIQVEKALQMHPLIGTETRPFQYHPLEQYGCVSCHSGEGRSLVAKRAHGPVFDGEYETSDSGLKPQFLEIDSSNDPRFAKMYNHKPAHDLIFQTTPILAASLVEAKCVQCHQPLVATFATPDEKRDIKMLISNYQKGRELFVSQACYSCHRIAGFSRNNVGPELTQSGLNYPWYIKESIVWPQADLPSSTMPNFKLDHEELEALMTFLMAQTGNTKAVSEVDYQIALSAWEKGKQMPWEEPVRMQDIVSAQTVFATEGCASCHRLQGFESKITLDAKQKQWFTKLFPENIQAIELAKIADDYAQEIDENIRVNEDKPNILEKIDAQFPALIESFYSNFKYALRAQDQHYRDDPIQLNAYRERLRRILKVYVAEYGLGRLIAPPLNWSGVFRDDEWLMGHFRNPALFTTKSLMPVMPFDDTKFYMLIGMLHKLGEKNKRELKEIWQDRGFDPAACYQRLCSSCHGADRKGNGSVAEWIFPIPKNLRDSIFLQTLSKERAIHSITHGIAGTPMPPWGKAINDNQPILSASEITQLVDWLYQDLDGNADQVKKWHYGPLDVIEEMKREKNFLQPIVSEGSSEELLHIFFKQQGDNFYIKDKFYTEENIQESKKFFINNCAACHGKEGAGTGVRASTMVEAKPRVFTDISWMQSYDDMHLLRAIKFGVPGTAMVPWGDQTTAAQRMQLVLFIRSLTFPMIKQKELQDLLFKVFDQKVRIVEETRCITYKKLENLEQELKIAKDKLEAVIQTKEPLQVGSNYVHIHNLQEKIQSFKTMDLLFKDLTQLLKEEKAIYSALGSQILAVQLPDAFIENFKTYIEHQSIRFLMNEEKLELKLPSEPSFFNMEMLDKIISEYTHKIDIEKSKISSSAQKSTVQTLTVEQASYIQLKSNILIELKRADALRQKQQDTFFILYYTNH